MIYEPLNRRLALLAAIFAFLGVLLGAIALATNYWTITPAIEPIYNGTTIVVQREIGRGWNVCIVFLRILANEYCLFIHDIFSRVFFMYVKLMDHVLLYFIQ